MDIGNTLDIENGLLSFSNPNYHLDPSDVNSNPEDYDELYDELDTVCRFSHKPAIQNRRSYAHLDSASMGVNVDSEAQPMLSADSENNIDNPDASSTNSGQLIFNSEDNNNTNVGKLDNKEMGRRTGFLDYYISLETVSRQHKKASLVQSNNLGNRSSNAITDISSSKPVKYHMTLGSEKSSSPEEDIPHIQTKISEDLYAVPLKRRTNPHDNQRPASLCNLQELESSSENSGNISFKDHGIDSTLPAGWEKHEDDSGPYYWHISSGTIQREPPPTAVINSHKMQPQISRDIDMISSISDFSLPSCKSLSPASAVSENNRNNPNNHTTDTKLKRRSYPEGSCSLTSDKKPIRFAVRSLGWVEIAEDDLTPERSSKAVNKCIVDLSMGRNDILDVVGRWGDGKDLYMDLDDYCLRLMDPQDFTILNTQPIHTIRVWGVGRDNGRDFAYVARDRVTRKHMCHVFRCDIPARIIANTLRDICKKIMIERSLQHSLAKPVVPDKNNVICGMNKGGPIRPTNLPTEQRRFHHNSSQSSYAGQSFPTPMEEPKKVLKVHYLGMTNVGKATGVEVLNSAIDQLSTIVPPAEYKFVNVAVAPSTITISEPGDDGKQLVECRVRFLSFLGIGKNVKNCGFIVHTAQDQFIAHIFYCEPSSGALCKTIEAACKLRYQKCLDAHRQVLEKGNAEVQENKGLATTIRSVLGSLTRLTRSAET